MPSRRPTTASLKLISLLLAVVACGDGSPETRASTDALRPTPQTHVALPREHEPSPTSPRPRITITDVGPASRTRDPARQSLAGPVRAMSGSPSGRRLYATGLRTGLWRSDDYGANWCQANTKVACRHPLTSPFFSPGVSQINEIAVSPTPADGSTVLLATGDFENSGFLKSYAGGVWTSNDAGRTWMPTYMPSCGKGAVVTQVRFAPDDPNTVFAAGSCGLAVSRNGGRNWTEVGRAPNGGRPALNYIAVSERTTTGNRVYACGAAGFAVSIDSGATFTTNFGLGPNRAYGCSWTGAPHALATPPTTPGTIVVTLANTSRGPRYFDACQIEGTRCGAPVNPPRGAPAECPAAASANLGCGEAGLWMGSFDPAARVVRWASSPLASPPSYFGQATPSGRPAILATRKPSGTGFYLFFADATTVHVHDGLPPIDSPAAPQLGRWARLDGQNPAEGDAPLFIHVDPHDVYVSDDFAATFAIQPGCAASRRAACANASLIHTAGRAFVANDGGLYASPAGTIRTCPKTLFGLLTPGCNLSPFATKPASGRGLGTLWMTGGATLSRPGASRPAHYSGTQDNDYFYVNPDSPPTSWDSSSNPDPATNWTGETGTCGDCGRFMADAHPAAADRVVQVDHPRGSSSFGIFATNGRYPTAPYQWCVGSNTPGCTPAFGSRDIGGGVRFYSVPFVAAPDGATSAPPIWGWGNRHVIQTLPAEIPTTTGTVSGCPLAADLVMLDYYEPNGSRPAPDGVTLFRAQVIDADRNTAACPSTPYTNRWGVVASGLPADTAIVQPAGGHANPVNYAWTRSGDLLRIANMGSWTSVLKVVNTASPGTNGACAVSSFFVNPYNSAMVYIDDPGSGACPAGIKITQNGGRTWTRVASLENLATLVGAPYGNPESRATEAWVERDYGVGGLSALLTDMVFVADEPRTRFAVGNTGVFATFDGVTWSRLADDRDFGCRAAAATFDKSTLAGRARSLYVTCYNRGMIRVDNIPDQAPPLNARIPGTEN
ncbi:MAG: hypothetical protein HYY84_03235 [Deltaproteobacteria bacterium]|nr:hypothetical protein [Deltaproteobacteria bacterium]